MSTDLPSTLMREGFGVLAVTVGLLQSATQINDPAVGFLPRLVTGLLVAYLTGHWALERLARYFAAALRGMSGHM
jgi:flagellar biosynthetic protein FliQ